MTALDLFKRNTGKPRLSIRERFRNTAAKILPRVSRHHRKGGGTDAGRRAVLAGSFAAAAVMPFPGVAAPGVDAELLRLDREHDAAFKRACTLVDPDDDALTEACGAYTDLEFTMQDIPAESWAGVAAKARIAANYVQRTEGLNLDNMLPSLIEDILRLANVSAKTAETWGEKEG